MMKTAGATKEIGIVLYPGVQAACVHGLTDLFGIAAGIASDQRRDSRAALRVTHWQPAHTRDARLSCVYDSDPRVSPQPRILIIPPTMMDLPDPDVPAGVVSWLRSRHEDGAKLVAVCSGAFILAATVWSPGVRFRHTAFAQRRWRSGFRKSMSTRSSGLLTMATVLGRDIASRTRCREETSHVLQHIDLADPQS
jgi:hypothetical protein